MKVQCDNGVEIAISIDGYGQVQTPHLADPTTLLLFALAQKVEALGAIQYEMLTELRAIREGSAT